MRNADIARLIVSILVCQSAGIFGSIFTVSAIPGWYAGLEKPFFNPPNWIFGPVWLALYTLMGISLFLVWKRGFEKADVRLSVKIFGLHLFLNALWSFLFFGLENLLTGLIGIIFVLMTLLFTMMIFHRVSRNAALILIPYLAWVSFATILNFSIWMLNL